MSGTIHTSKSKKTQQNQAKPEEQTIDLQMPPKLFNPLELRQFWIKQGANAQQVMVLRVLEEQASMNDHEDKPMTITLKKLAFWANLPVQIAQAALAEIKRKNIQWYPPVAVDEAPACKKTGS